MKRPLPTVAEAAEILARKRTRPQRRPPPPAGAKLNSLVRSLDARFGEGVGGLAARWREIVGDPLARNTEPVKVIKSRTGAGGALEIRVDGPAAALIQHQAPQILERANLFLGEGAVARLRIVQGPVQTRAPVRTTAKAKRRPPLDAAQEAELEVAVSGVEDDALRRSLMRLGRNVLREDRSR